MELEIHSLTINNEKKIFFKRKNAEKLRNVRVGIIKKEIGIIICFFITVLSKIKLIKIGTCYVYIRL